MGCGLSVSLRQGHFYQAVECDVVGDTFHRDAHLVLGLTFGICNTYACEIAVRSVSVRVANKSLEDFFALDPSTIRVHCRSDDKETDLTILVADDLRFDERIGENIGRFDQPFGLLQLLVDDLNSKRVYISRCH